MNSKILLTDEFAEFSGKITALHEKKKELIDEMKKVINEHKKAVAEIEQEAQQLQANFDQWASGQNA
jgi:vacuolar-type H+-ATPase subunit D/Vma8